MGNSLPLYRDGRIVTNDAYQRFRCFNEKEILKEKCLGTDTAFLLSRKKKLERECFFLEKQIREKKQLLIQLEADVNNSIHDTQAASASKLAAGLAHEIRNPLTTIKGFIQLLMPELASLKKEEFAEIALDEIARANDLLSDFLSVMKPGFSGKKIISVNELIITMEKLFMSEALLKKITLLTDLPSEDLMIWADDRQLKQVFINLLKNAFESVDEKGSDINSEIKIKIVKKDGFTEISVTDNGTGMDRKVLDKIFTPFYSTKEKGTGVGLVICQQITEAHGGRINVESQKGVGTVFTISLPLVSSS